MPLSLTTFANGTTITASDIRGRIESIEQYVNENMPSSDLKSSSPWVNSTHIFKPNFFLSPSPRAELVSGDLWYRKIDGGRENYAVYHSYHSFGDWIPIPGATCTIRNPLSVNVKAVITASVYGFTISGYPSIAPISNLYVVQSAEIRLEIDRTMVTGTRRELYALPTSGSNTNHIESRENIHVMGQEDLTPGTHHIGLAINLTESTFSADPAAEEPDWKHTFLSVRNITVETHHLAT